MSEAGHSGGSGRPPGGPVDLGAWEAHATALESDPGTLPDARAIHAWLLQVDPARVGSLRALHRIDSALGSWTAAGAVASVIRLLDPSFGGAQPPPLDSIPRPSDEALAAIRPVGLEVLDEIFGLLFQSSAVFRGDVYGASSTQRVSTPNDVELFRVHAAGVRVLGLPGTPMLVRRGTAVEVAVTDPPSVVVGGDLQATEPVARFLLGRALDATRPGRVLAAALGADASSAVHEAVVMAFGPRSTDRPTLSKGADAIVKELWSLPPRVQRRLEELAGDASLGWGADAWRLRVRQAGNRAGLLLAGDAAPCLELVASESEALRGLDPRSETGFREAARRCPEFADLAAFAVSPDYLAIRWGR